MKLFGKQVSIDSSSDGDRYRAAEVPSSDGVDTTLSLSTILSANYNVNVDAADTTLRLSMIKTLVGVPHSQNIINITDNDDEVMINLAAKFGKEIIDKSSFLGLGINDRSRNYKINDYDQHHKIIALNPIQLRPYHPTYDGCMHAYSQDDDTADKGSIGNSGSSTIDHQGSTSSGIGKRKSPKRKQKNILIGNNKEGKKKRARIRSIEYSEPNMNLSCEFILNIIGTRPVFLYRKKLVESDVKKGQNRLFITRTKKLMELLTEEERDAVTDDKKPGVNFIGVDRMGRRYKLRFNKWESLGIIIINKQWSKMVVDNGAKTDDWVDLWGYRDRDSNFCLVVNFSQ